MNQPAATAPQQAPEDNIATLEQPRLNFPPPAVMENLGMDKALWRTYTEAIWPAAKTVEGVLLAVAYCKARGLDPIKKPVHVVPVWSSSLNKEVEGVWPSINEHRTTAMRTNAYAGCDEAETGDDVTQTFTGKVKKKNNQWEDRSVEVTFPEWSQVTVYKIIQGHRVPFVGPKVYWLETYAKYNNFVDLPNAKWTRSPRYMLEKCAEAAALRRAFPEECGENTIEEMEGKDIGGMIEHEPVSADAPTREDFVDSEPGAEPTDEPVPDPFILHDEFGEVLGTCLTGDDFLDAATQHVNEVLSGSPAAPKAFEEMNAEQLDRFSGENRHNPKVQAFYLALNAKKQET